MRYKPVTWLLHIALGIIVLGACVTHFFGEQGDVHLRLCETASLTTNHSTLSIFLWDFQVVNSPETNMPVDFISELRIIENGQLKNDKGELLVASGTVRMNKPFKYHGYRFCQSDYDNDGQGVVLAYNYDPWGIGITYTGYALLLVAMIGFFFQPNTRFRVLLRSLTAKRSYNAVVLQRSGLAVLAVIVIVLSVVMTVVVTPKPPLQPVLQTPLLGIHVSVIMLAYTLFAIIAINGIIGLCAKSKREQLMHLSQILLYPALFSLTAGIFIGAVWANMSWGRYWGWDPKETWALITMLVYALLLHFPWLKRLTAKWSNSETVLQAEPVQQRSGHVVYHILSIIAFLFVLFTYFGVNYFLGGLHSYA